MTAVQLLSGSRLRCGPQCYPFAVEDHAEGFEVRASDLFAVDDDERQPRTLLQGHRAVTSPNLPRAANAANVGFARHLGVRIAVESCRLSGFVFGHRRCAFSGAESSRLGAVLTG